MKNRFAMAFVAASALLASSASDASANTTKARHHHHHFSKARHATEDQPQSWEGQVGMASYYSNRYQGRVTSSGAAFDQKALTAAHGWLPLGTKVRVTLANTAQSVIVTINDRIHSRGRMIDLSHAAAEQLGIVQRGLARVSLMPV